MIGEMVQGARWTIFGHEAAPVELVVLPRERSWRARRAAVVLGGAALLAPPLAILPPHFVWSFGSLLAGATIARNRWRERHTILALGGDCPRCGATAEVSSGVRLRSPHPLECSGCGHQGSVVFDAAALPDPR